MNLDTFFEKFDLFADAPNAVAKMRELVLELAVQGKIVEQRPAEGGGHALLRLIQKENPPSKIEHEPESVDAELPSYPEQLGSQQTWRSGGNYPRGFFSGLGEVKNTF